MKHWLKLVCAGVLLLALPLAAQKSDGAAPGGHQPIPNGTKLTLTMTFADGTTLAVPVLYVWRAVVAGSATGAGTYVINKEVDTMSPLLQRMLATHTAGKLAVIEAEDGGVSKIKNKGQVVGAISISEPRIRVIKKLSPTLEEVTLDSASGKVTNLNPPWIGSKPVDPNW